MEYFSAPFSIRFLAPPVRGFGCVPQRYQHLKRVSRKVSNTETSLYLRSPSGLGTENDRISSKRTVKQLESGNGAPGTQLIQEPWIGRFNAFRQLTLKQSLDEPFGGDDLLRFFDEMLDKIRPKIAGKPALSSDFVRNKFTTLIKYGTLTYTKASGFEITRRDMLRMQTFIDDAVCAGRLTKGCWNKRVGLNFILVSRLGRSWLRHHHQQGTLGWDLVLARLLSIVLVSSLGCRPGDVARSPYYKGAEYLKYRNVNLRLEGKPQWKNLRAQITLEFCKGKKDKQNANHEVYLRALEDPHHQHACPITLLIIHALRHGLVRGSTVEEVLENAAMAANKQVEWLYPHYPVLAASGSNHSCDVERPAAAAQLLASVKKMALVSNFLSFVTVEALRRGAAQDLAHLPPPKDGAGFTENKVRQSFNHSSAAQHAGITENYAGGPTREYFNDRVNRAYVHPGAPKFGKTSAHEVARGFVSDEEIRKWQLLHEPEREDRGGKTARARARRNIRRARLASYLATAAPEQTGSDIPREDSTAFTAPVALTPRTTAVPRPEVQPLDDCPSTLPPSAGNKHMLNDEDPTGIANIDPQLLEPGLNSVHVKGKKLDSLLAQLLPENVPIESAEESDDQEGLEREAFFNEQDTNKDLGINQIVDTNEDQPPMSACEFVATYAKINIVSHSAFARAWLRRDTNSIADFSTRGHSRDEPTPMFHRCNKTPGCVFQHVWPASVVYHQKRCSPVYVAQATREAPRQSPALRLRAP